MFEDVRHVVFHNLGKDMPGSSGLALPVCAEAEFICVLLDQHAS